MKRKPHYSLLSIQQRGGRRKVHGSVFVWTIKLLVLVLLAISSLFLVLIIDNLSNRVDKLRRPDDVPDVDMRVAFLVEEQLERDSQLVLEHLRNLVLIVTYSPYCPLCQLIKRSDEIFFVDVNQKLISSGHKSLRLKFDGSSNTGLTSSISLIRSTFDCGKDNTSLLLSPLERERCMRSRVRVVSTHFLSLAHLESIARQYRLTAMIYLMPMDPRSLYFQHHNTTEVKRAGKNICLKMLRDLERAEEQGMVNPFSHVTIHTEIFLLNPWKIWQKLASRVRLKTARILSHAEKTNFTKSYEDSLLEEYSSWINEKQYTAKVLEIDKSCVDFYERSIYRSLKEPGGDSFRFKQIELPLRTAVFRRQLAKHVLN